MDAFSVTLCLVTLRQDFLLDHGFLCLTCLGG